MVATLASTRLVYTADELAEALHLAPSTVRLMCQRGEVEGAFKAGRLWRIPQREYVRRVGDAAAGHEPRGGDAVQRSRERALRDVETRLEDLLRDVRRALGD